MRTVFVIALLLSIALNVLFFVARPRPAQLAPVTVESIDSELQSGKSGRFDCVVNHYANVRLSDGSVRRIRITGPALESIR